MNKYTIVTIVLFFLLIPGCRKRSQINHVRELPLQAHKLATISAKTIEEDPFNFIITKMENGVIVTNWELYQGSEHGIFWWKKNWIGNARYTIIITPLYSDPEKKSLLEISWETRERPNENYPWETVMSSHGPTRASVIMDAISNKSRVRE